MRRKGTNIEIRDIKGIQRSFTPRIRGKPEERGEPARGDRDPTKCRSRSANFKENHGRQTLSTPKLIVGNHHQSSATRNQEEGRGGGLLAVRPGLINRQH